jgi:hypothetical protein
MRTFILILTLSVTTLASDPFWAMYEMPTIAEKKAIWRGLSDEERVYVRRMNFNWGINRLRLDGEQIEYLDSLSFALPGLTLEEADAFQREAEILFTVNEGYLLFGSVGPYRPCSAFSMRMPTESMLQPGYCNCSLGSSFNASCSGTCGPGVCRSTSDGCGFAWLYPCAALCMPD